MTEFKVQTAIRSVTTVIVEAKNEAEAITKSQKSNSGEWRTVTRVAVSEVFPEDEDK
jgi:hypothetical protein